MSMLQGMWLTRQTAQFKVTKRNLPKKTIHDLQLNIAKEKPEKDWQTFLGEVGNWTQEGEIENYVYTQDIAYLHVSCTLT